MPNHWTDVTAQMRSWAEQKVVEYVLRHTWGYQEYGQLKRISLDEFEHGRRRADRSRLDRGVGLRRQAIISGLRRAVEDGYLVVAKDDSDKGRVRKSYGLKMDSRARGYEDHTPGVRSSDLSSPAITHRTEKETLERNTEKETVKNGGSPTPVAALPDLDQPDEQTRRIAEETLEQLGDRHSHKFYLLVAAKTPYQVIRRALSEIKVDGATHPAKVFTFRMNQYALNRLKQEIG